MIAYINCKRNREKKNKIEKEKKFLPVTSLAGLSHKKFRRFKIPILPLATTAQLVHSKKTGDFLTDMRQ